jgi:HEPN domain-containing protein
MGQQAVEKLSKALYLLYIDDNIPRIHSIRQILEIFENKLSEQVPQDWKLFFDEIPSYYISTRYSEYKPKLTSMEAFEWLLTLKP